MIYHRIRLNILTLTLVDVRLNEMFFAANNIIV